MPKILRIEKPENFDFRYTVLSHGWSNLPPFELKEEEWRLSYVSADEKSNKAVAATIREAAGKLEVEIFDDEIPGKFAEKILRDFRHILRFDDNLGEFYKITASEKELAWIGRSNAGRLLRSPTVFEDLVKTICTTNCSWSLTKKMVTNLVEKLGEKTADGKSAFPTAEKMASVPAEFYR